jgi:putative membrane protein
LRPDLHQNRFLFFGPKSSKLPWQLLSAQMQPNSKKIVRFLISWFFNTVAVLVAAVILRNHITYNNKLPNLLVASFILGMLNAFVRPILMLIALPLLIFTLGLFTFVINGLLLYFVGYLMEPSFKVDSFGYAFLGALIISIVSTLLNAMTGNARISVQRRGPPNPPKNPGGGNGPVIDV